MINHSSSLDSHITEASIGKPDPKFWIELEKVIDEIKNSLTDGASEEQRLYFSQEIAQLESLLEIGGKGNNLRRLQREALEAIITMLRRGESEGYIKLPTGVGKTILFALIISAIKQPTLIMVPGKDLIEQTKETFEDGFGYAPGEVKGLLLENGTASEELENFLNETEEIERNGVIICTNDSLKSIYRTNPELLQRLYGRIQVLVTDEAHKALGEVHREMMDEGFSGELNKLHLLFTATPELSKKHVNEHYRPVFEATLQEAVNDGILVLPNHVGPEIAYLNVSSDAITSPTQEFLDAHSLKFLDENRRPIYESLTDEYLRIKQNSPHGYAPALAVCATISQVDTIVTYLESRGLRAAKVVSDKDSSGVENLAAACAKELINTDQLDVIVTVKKVAEGWDVPTLRNIIRYYPTLSPAQLVQSFGRVIRQVEWKHIEEMIRMMHERGIHTDLSLNEIVDMLLKTRENTNLIEPAQWQMRRSNFERREDDDDDGDDGDDVEGGDGPAGGDRPGSEEDDEVFFTLSHTIQALVNKNELSADEARGFYPGISIRRDINYMSDKELKEYFKTQLLEKGVVDRESLLEFGAKRFEKELGVSGIGRLLGKTLVRVSIEDIKDLATSLDLEERKSERKEFYIQSFKNKLAEEKIINYNSLLEFGPGNFRKTFGFSEMGKLLGRTISSVTIENLRELATVLNLEKEDWIKLFKVRLAEKDIIDKKSLMNYGVENFQQDFGRVKICQLLGIESRNIKKEDLEELSKVLELEEWDSERKKLLIQEFKEELLKQGVKNKIHLLEFGPKKFQRVFGNSDISKRLGMSFSRVTKNDLEELSQILKLEDVDLGDLFKCKLLEKGIKDHKDLMDYGAEKFQKSFGRNEIGQLLGKKISYVITKNLEELSKVLELEEWNQQKKKLLIQEFKGELLKKGINNNITLMNYGVENFQQDFGRVKICQLLGIESRNIKKEDLEKFSKILGLDNINLGIFLKTRLLEKGIKDHKSLIEYSTKKFQKDFGVSELGQFLGKSITKITIGDLEELSKALELEEWNQQDRIVFIKEFKSNLKEKGIKDRVSLTEYGVAEFRKSFGRKTPGKLLGRVLLNGVTNDDLIELSNILGW